MLSPSRFLRAARRGDAPASGEHAAQAGDSLRVVVSGRPPSHQVGFVDQIIGDDSAGEAPRGLTVEFRDSIRGAPDTDVVFLTSVSAVVGDRRVPAGERARRARRFAKSLRRRRVVLVRALHDDTPVSRTTPSQAELILDRAASAFISMSPATRTREERTTNVIPHSHLRARFLGYPRADSERGRLLLLAPSGFTSACEAPLKVFAAASLDEWTLRVAGRVPPPLTRSFARTVARHPARITLRDESMSDAALVDEVTRAELVVIADPETREAMRITMLALSLDRPVLAEATPTTRLMAEEVGRDWVRVHQGPLTAATLEDELSRLRSHPVEGCPQLAAREPNAIAAQYAAAFRAAAAAG